MDRDVLDPKPAGIVVRWLVFAAALLGALSACGGTPQDVAANHVIACEVYTDVLEQIAANKTAGLYTPDELAGIRSIERATTPACLGTTPSTTDLALVRRALVSLNSYLLAEAVEEGR